MEEFKKSEGKIEIVESDPNHPKNRNTSNSVQSQSATQSPTVLPPMNSPAVTQPNFYSANDPNHKPRFYDNVPLHLLHLAGLRAGQAQHLNYLIIKNQIELQKRFEERQMDFYYAVSMQNLKNNSQPVAEATIPISANIFSIEELDKFNDEFSEESKAVKVRSSDTRGGWIYMLRDESINRHVEFRENQLIENFKDWLYLRIGERIDDIPSKTLERMIIKLKHKIPELQFSNLTILQEQHLRLNNGIFYFQPIGFYNCLPNANLFNTYSLNITYEDCNEPTVFEELLDDITARDEMIKKLIYEIIGAVISNTTLLKRIFVFQGVSNGGKTRLMKIISRLLSEIDVDFVNTVSEVTSDQFKNAMNLKHLICVNDSADKKLASVQTSYLKSFADGNINSNGNATKLIIATNYAITSGNNGFVEPALINRLLVVPFKKAMDNEANVGHFEDDFFEKEKLGIICKSLNAFGEVFRNGRRFCCNPKLNDPEVVTTGINNSQESFTDTEKKKVAEIKLKGGDFSSTMKAKLFKIVDELYELTEGCNSDMTIETIANEIKKIDSTLLTNTQQLGKDLKVHFLWARWTLSGCIR